MKLFADDDTPADRLVQLLRSGGFREIGELAALHRAHVQMIGVRAALRRHLWEHRRLPARLEDLGDPELTRDPFTEKPFVYKVTGPRSFELSSGAPRRIGDNGGIVPATEPAAR